MKHRGVFAPLEVDRLRYHFYSLYSSNPYLIILDSNNYLNDEFSSFEILLATGAECIPFSDGSCWNQLKSLFNKKNWLLGYIGYDVKNETINIQSGNEEHTSFPEIFFFNPIILIRQSRNELIIESDAEFPEVIYSQLNLASDYSRKYSVSLTNISNRTPKEKYLNSVNQIKQDIVDGNYYELNYCQEFYAEDFIADPFTLYQKMNKVSMMPFGSFLKVVDCYVVCCSPERFLKKAGNTLISQPIKGTAARDLVNSSQDEENKLKLQINEKERAENVMIVDLVRNDLTRSSETGSVSVRELCQVYSYSNVHQMISTITSELRQDVHPIDALRLTFPMGSMTGAPKIEVMKRIEQLEDTKRNVYSGCLGYINPDGDFDFNVIIRTLLYNAQTRYASYHTGSAITYDSIPEMEYEECLLKAQTFFSLLSR